VVATIALAGVQSVAGVAVNPITNRMYVLGYFAAGDGVVVLDGATNQIVATVSLNACRSGLTSDYFSNIAVDPASNHVFVMGTAVSWPDEYDYFNNVELADIDGSTNTVSCTHVLGPGDAAGVEVDPLAHTVSVTATGIASWSVINYDTGQTITVYAHALLGMDETSHAVVSNMPAGTSPGALVDGPSEHRAYVATMIGSANQAAPVLAVVSSASNHIVKTLPLSAQPGSLANNPKTHRLYADDNGASQTGNVAVIDETTNLVTATVPLAGTGGVAVNPAAHRLDATATLNALWVIDGATTTVVTSITVGSPPSAVAVNPLNGRVDVLTYFDSTLTVIQLRLR
jgi:DNA-binding beta-propeller fold protein YncE